MGTMRMGKSAGDGQSARLSEWRVVSGLGGAKPLPGLDAGRQAIFQNLGVVAHATHWFASVHRTTTSSSPDALTSFVDNGIEEAKEVVTNLLQEGGDAAKRIAETWSKELSGGAKEVIDGLADLGDAAADALGNLAEAGVDAAKDAWNKLKGEGVPFVPWI